MKNKLTLFVCMLTIVLNMQVWTLSAVWSLRIVTLTLSNFIIVVLAVYKKTLTPGEKKA